MYSAYSHCASFCTSFVLLCMLLAKSIDGKLELRCYLASWSLTNSGDNPFKISDLDPNYGCDVIIYAFFKVEKNRLQSPDGNKYTGHFHQLNLLKLGNPKLQIYLSVGGWLFSRNGTFSMVAGSAANRTMFVNSAVADLRKWQLDGLDVDWEFPELTDKDNFVMLLKDLRLAFEQEAAMTNRTRLGLSIAVGNKVFSGYDVPEIAKYIDLVMVMTYDYHGIWGLMQDDNTTSLAAGMTDVKATIKEWNTAGIPYNKLSLGLPFYGHSWSLTTPDGPNALGQPVSGPGDRLPISQEKGIIVMLEYCARLSPHWEYVFPKPNDTDPIAYARKHDQWINIDTQDVLKAKVRWAKQEQLQGVFMWHLAQDDVRGKCGVGPFPLLNAITEEITGQPPPTTAKPSTASQLSSTTPLTTLITLSTIGISSSSELLTSTISSAIVTVINTTKVIVTTAATSMGTVLVTSPKTSPTTPGQSGAASPSVTFTWLFVLLRILYSCKIFFYLSFD